MERMFERESFQASLTDQEREMADRARFGPIFQGAAMPSMSSQRPICCERSTNGSLDNGCTPYLVIDADAPGVQVPRQYVNEGRIRFNVARQGAVNALIIGNSEIDFDCRFGGVSTHLTPLHAVRGIYARRMVRGLIFDPTMRSRRSGGPDRTAGKSSPRHLSVVKVGCARVAARDLSHLDAAEQLIVDQVAQAVDDQQMHLLGCVRHPRGDADLDIHLSQQIAQFTAPCRAAPPPACHGHGRADGLQQIG